MGSWSFSEWLNALGIDSYRQFSFVSLSYW